MLIATFRLDPGAVALAETLATVPDLEVEAERIAAHSTQWTMPCLWASNADFDAVDNALTADPSVETIVDTTQFAEEKFYQLNWSDAVTERIDTYVDHEGSILNAQATVDGWQLRIRFVSRDQFDQFRDRVHDQGYSFALLAITQPNEPRHAVGDLTPAQRDALRAAKKRGYFEVPRAISTRDLAAELDMSHQNLSKLLRRGTESLIDETLDTSADIDEP